MDFNYKSWFKRGFTQKAMPSTQGYSLSSIAASAPEFINTTKDHLKLMQMDRGTAHTVNTLVADEFASWSRKLYAVVDSGRAGKMLTPHGICNKALSTALSKSAHVNMRNGAKTFTELYEHPFLSLIESPWEGWNEFQFFSYLMQQLGIIGNAYVVKHLDGSGQLIGLEPLMGEYVQVTVDRQGRITEYKYNPIGDFPMDQRKFSPSELVHFKQMENGSTIIGKGTIESVQLPAMLSHNLEQYAASLYGKKCVPSNMILLKGYHPKLNPETGLPDLTVLENFKQNWISKFGGSNRNENYFGYDDIEIKQIAQNLKDSGVETMAPLMESKILQAWHVSDSIFKGGDANKSIMVEATKNLRRFGVLPKAINVITTLNKEVVKKYYDTDLLYWWDVIEVEGSDPAETKDILVGYKQAGIYSTNDCLSKLGEPVRDGEEYDKPIAANASTALQSQAAGINPNPNQSI